MPVDVAVAMARSVRIRRHWQIYDLTVSHPSFGDDVVGELLHVFTGSLQDRHLHAAFVVQVNVKRGLRQIMMIVEIASESLWKFALVMVVNVNESGKTLSSPCCLHCMLLQA